MIIAKSGASLAIAARALAATAVVAFAAEAQSVQAVRLDGQAPRVDGRLNSFDIEPQDFNVRSFRSNLVLRWEWRAGSTMYLVWQQDREVDRGVGTVRPLDMWDSLKAPGNNFLAIKVSYWLAP